MYISKLEGNKKKYVNISIFNCIYVFKYIAVTIIFIKSNFQISKYFFKLFIKIINKTGEETTFSSLFNSRNILLCKLKLLNNYFKYF